jgi:anti-sigma factor RsiW
MSCHERQAQLQDYLSGELAPAQRQEAKAHLEQCASCRADVESYRVLISSLPDLPDPSVPDDLTDQVMEAIRPQWAVLRRQRETTTAA